MFIHSIGSSISFSKAVSAISLAILFITLSFISILLETIEGLKSSLKSSFVINSNAGTTLVSLNL